MPTNGVLARYRKDEDFATVIAEMILEFKSKRGYTPEFMIVEPSMVEHLKDLDIEVIPASSNKHPCQPGHVIFYPCLKRRPVLSIERTPCE